MTNAEITNGENKSGMQCIEFEALLADALDGLLTPEAMAGFRVHSGTCASCGPLFTEVETGRKWLTSLTLVEPPQHLVHNILVATSGLKGTRDDASSLPKISFWQRLRPRLSLRPAFALVTEPRFGLSVAMAFFSLSLAMSVAGVKLSDLQKLDLRPSAIDRTYHETQSRVVRYYDNIRFVYEVESRVRELRRTIQPAEPAPKRVAPQTGQPERKDDTSKKPSQERQQNYLSQGQRGVILAQQQVTTADFNPRSMA